MRHLFKIDAGENFIISAEDEAQAREMYAAEYDDAEEIKTIVQMDDAADFTVILEDVTDPPAKVTKTCQEWAAEDAGVIASSLW